MRVPMMLLLGVIFVTAPLVVSDLCTSVPAASRKDCHPEQESNINAARSTCEGRGCQWCEHGTAGVPWCFYKPGTCPSLIGESDREDCMWTGIATKETCESRGCVYCESATQGVPWCFFNGPKPGGDTCPAGVPDDSKIDCYPSPVGDIKNECINRGCFYCASSTAGVPWCFYDTSKWTNVLRDEEKVNCIPEKKYTNKDECQSRGCTYSESSKSDVPWCYVPLENGYDVVGDVIDTVKGHQIRLKRGSVSIFGNSIDDVLLDIEYQTNSRIRFKFSDAGKSRFEVPLTIPSPDAKAANPLYAVEVIKSPAFALKIIRKDTGTVLFDTSIGGLVMEDQFLQIATRLPSSNVYGFGMHQHESFKHNMNYQYWGMFSRDQPPAEKANMYGVHPFYECVEGDGKTHGVLFLNSNAQDVLLQPAPSLSYRTIGGILDMYMFLGPSPEEVISQYTEAVGRPMLPPYWSLGFSLARFGYHTLDHMKGVVNKMKNQNMPMDFIFGDIDYMERYLDFTYDVNRYGGYPEYIKELQRDGIRTILILDPAIATGETAAGRSYPPFEDGNRANVWVKRPDNSPATGKVWPESNVYFPDFLNPSTTDWWVNHCKSLKKLLNYDGLWIDMNEPANFVWGDINGCPDNSLNKPPYFPKIYGPVLAYKTLCPDHKHHNDVPHYNVHSLYGWSQSKTTFKAVREATGNRSIVLSRSTFPGSGKYVATWLGDNYSYWSHLKYSVIGLLELNIFGIPMVGADICGFFRNAEYEMCMRWHQLGAFYPFSRNHNMVYEVDQMQEPTEWGAFFADNARYHLNVRYTLLPYLYTLFYRAHVYGETVVRALVHEFPADSKAWAIDEQFLWGKAFLISPVLYQGATSVSAYFPGSSDWYSYYDGTPLSSGSTHVLSAPMTHIPLHVRGGFILPTQEPAVNTMLSRKNRMGLIVALDSNTGSAVGELFWDDGESMATFENGKYALTRYEANRSGVSSTILQNGYDGMSSQTLGRIRVFGLTTPNIASVKVNGASHSDFTQTAHELTIKGLSLRASNEFTISWA